MKKFIKQLIVAVVVVTGIVTYLPASTALAIDVTDQACQGYAANDPNSPAICQASASNDIGNIIQTVINILLFVVGAISVVMIIVGGIRYATSAGSADAVKAAKNTVLYAIVGLVVAFLAFAIVNWVLGALF